MDAQQPIEVGNRKQLFIDDRWFATSHGVHLRMNPPVKAERVIAPEMPWEQKGLQVCHTIIEHEGEYKLWYETGVKGKQGCRDLMCYATSQDGVHFERRNVNVFEFDGSLDNNIVVPGGQAVVMLDPTGPDESRFKMLSWFAEDDLWPEVQGTELRSYDIYVGTSPDGIHWKLVKPAALPFCHDTHNQMFYDTRLGTYVAYVRTHEHGRTVSRVQVDDPLSPPFPYRDLPVTNIGSRGTRMPPRGLLDVVMFCDQSDPPHTDLYTPYVHQYAWADNAYFSFPSPYRHYPVGDDSDTLAEGQDERGRYVNDGLLEVQLGVSRDGIHWTRPDRRPYIPLGLKGSYDGACIYMSTGMIRKGAEIWQYYLGMHYTHGQPEPYDPDLGPGGWLCRLVQRLDGFVSADADYTGA